MVLSESRRIRRVSAERAQSRAALLRQPETARPRHSSSSAPIANAPAASGQRPGRTTVAYPRNPSRIALRPCLYPSPGLSS